jgi:predicted membrane-bound dolichyl-phosphate-mannose-protein mannosyltransferase
MMSVLFREEPLRWRLNSGIALLLLLIVGTASAQTQATPAEKEDAAFPSTDCTAKAASLKK